MFLQKCPSIHSINRDSSESSEIIAAERGLVIGMHKNTFVLDSKLSQYVHFEDISTVAADHFSGKRSPKHCESTEACGYMKLMWLLRREPTSW